MDVNSISFQMFLLMLSFIILGSESQISVFKQCQSNTQMSDIFKGGGGHPHKPKFGDTALRSVFFFFSITEQLQYF